MKTRPTIISFVFIFACVIFSHISFSFASDYENLLPENLTVQEVFEPGLEMPVGMVTQLQDYVMVIHENTPNTGFELKNYLPLFKGDLIITSRKGMVQIKLNDESLISLASLSKLELNRSIYDPETKNRSSFLKMSVGKARFFIKKLFGSTQSDFKVKTSTAVVGVRGTIFMITADEESTDITTGKDSRVEVSGEGTTIMLSDFEKIVVETGTPPAPNKVEKVSYEQFQGIEQEFRIRTDTSASIAEETPVAAAPKADQTRAASTTAQPQPDAGMEDGKPALEGSVTDIKFDENNILVSDDALVEPDAMTGDRSEELSDILAIEPGVDAAVHNSADMDNQNAAADIDNEDVAIEVREDLGRIEFPPLPE